VYGLFQGHTATLLRVFPYAAIKFVAYDQIRDQLIPTKEQEVWYRRIAAGSLAGLTSVLFTYPLELVRVRLAFETQTRTRISLRAIMSQIYHERDKPIALAQSSDSAAGALHQHNPLPSIRNFYRGFLPTMAGMLPYAGVSFWAHDFVGDIIRSPALAKYSLKSVPARNEREERHPKLKGQWEAVAGGVAGLLAQTSSYPLEVVRRRMQVGGAVGNREMKGFWQTVRTIYSSGGVRGFYVGLSIGYVKVSPLWGD
jgi:solute carrier family 25 protein 16